MNCKICDTETDVVFIIKREKQPVCETCATQIFIQQAKKYAKSQSIYDIPKTVTKPKEIDEEKVKKVLNYLYNRLLFANRNFESNLPKAYAELIAARLEEGYTVEQMMAVAHHKYKEWGQDPEMKRYLKADTLYRPKNFERYVAEIPEQINPQNSKKQREILRKLNRFIITGERNEETKQLVEELKSTGYNKQNILKQFE